MSNQVTSTGSAPKKKLQIVGQAPAMDIEQELAAFEEAEKKRLGLDGKTEQWIEDMVGLTFTKAERKNVTVLVGGLTIAHDYLVEGALKGVGYNVAMLDVPDTAAFQVGKEFGNRGQCNPTYFTVGNLVKTLQTLRDKHGLSSEEVVKKFVFLTAGACGPCRFGMYVTEYRKALRDAGFEGFRVLLFQQTGGVKQATGDELGLELGPAFFWAIIKAIFAGDVLNALGYRMRPYEVKAGETDKALEASKKIIYEALEKQTMILPAIWRCKPLFEAVELDRTMPKPKISIIGEFWAMTTEGDGNYGLQRFLEQEGAEADIQLVAAWILYMIWEGKHDTLDRKDLREHDFAKYGLGDIGNYGATVKLAALKGADLGVRALFQTFAYTLGLYGYHLPDMDKIADVSDQYYSNDLRGGEGHMEVGKLILNVVNQKANITVSVKPFGCMPSSGVSDGVQSLITARYPGSIFCAVETSGDGAVNFYSRVQMYMFKARAAAETELQKALDDTGLTLPQVRAFLDRNPRFSELTYYPGHTVASTAANLVHEVAPLIKLSRSERAAKAATAAAARAKDAVVAIPGVARKARDFLTSAENRDRIRQDASLLADIVRGKAGEHLTPLAKKLVPEILFGRLREDHHHSSAGPVAIAAE